jgi:hypothetical protein
MSNMPHVSITTLHSTGVEADLHVEIQKFVNRIATTKWLHRVESCGLLWHFNITLLGSILKTSRKFIAHNSASSEMDDAHVKFESNLNRCDKGMIASRKLRLAVPFQFAIDWVDLEDKLHFYLSWFYCPG